MQRYRVPVAIRPASCQHGRNGLALGNGFEALHGCTEVAVVPFILMDALPLVVANCHASSPTLLMWLPCSSLFSGFYALSQAALIGNKYFSLNLSLFSGLSAGSRIL